MKRKSIIPTVTAVLLTAGLLGPSPARAYEKWVEFTIVRITEPAADSTVPRGKTITLKCVAALDIDVVACTGSPTPVDDTLTFTWTASSGTLHDNSGTQVTWTAPAIDTEVTITVTASDDPSPVYADDTDRSHLIKLHVVNPGIVYVKHDATGADNGTSWANAYTDLNNAITNASAGSELWVAAGTYKPATASGIAINKNVKIYGGFTGTETAVYQRDWTAHETILSGDIGTDDDDSDNSYHVVTIADSGAALDGFTITKGRGPNTDGAGAYISSCSPLVQNCLFTDNIADYGDGDGGGMHCYRASPTVIQCLFLSNQAGDDGGGVCNKKGSSGKFINCAFYNNWTHNDNAPGKSDGGAIYNTASEEWDAAASNPVFINCVIAHNATGRYGGGAALGQPCTPSSEVKFLNCTFYDNTASGDGGGIACKNGNTTTVKNCILWADKIGLDYDELMMDATSTIDISYSDVQGGSTTNGNINSDPRFAQTTDLDGPDNRWLTCDDGLRIRFGSPCVDAADGNAKYGYTDAGANDHDALGLKNSDIKTVSDTGTGTSTYYDMGAYEALVEHVIFISVDGLSAYWLEDSSLMGSASGSVMPNMKTLKNEGLWTFNARCDAGHTETIPNHTTMITGRPVYKKTAWDETIHHGWWYNQAMTNMTWTLHMDEGDYGRGNDSLDYEGSVFDVVHDYGLTTALYAGKDKFIIYEWSYDLDHGNDNPLMTGESRDKIDTFEWTTDAGNSTAADWNSNTLITKFISGGVAEYPFNFTFFHFKGPDKVGHNSNSGNGPVGPWGSTGWDNVVKTVDTHLGTMMTLIKTASNKDWYYNTVIIITADHGGIDYGHSTRVEQVIRIPFGVWGHLIPTGDMYDWCANSRTRPTSTSQDLPYPDNTSNMTGQPIRHADGTDLALTLLGLRERFDAGAIIKGLNIGYNPQ